MNYLSSSIMFDPLCSQNDEIFLNISDFVPPIQLEGNQIIPTFIEDPLLNTDNNQRKRSFASSKLIAIEHDQENGMNPYDRKKRQKIIHREIERKRRLEMSSLHTSLKSLLPLECTKGKRSMSDHLGEAEKYIKQMQKKMNVLNDKRDALRKEMFLYKRHENDNDVTVNVFKGSIEVIVSTSCSREDDGNNQGLPLSKVLQCLLQEGFDVVSSISKKANANFVHSIHAQVGDENKSNIAIAVTNLKRKLADIQRWLI